MGVVGPFWKSYWVCHIGYLPIFFSGNPKFQLISYQWNLSTNEQSQVRSPSKRESDPFFGQWHRAVLESAVDSAFHRTVPISTA